MDFYDDACQIVEDGFYDLAVALMDDEIRERLCHDVDLCSQEDFLEAYMAAHFEKYGCSFTI